MFEVEGIGIKVFTLSFLLLTLQCVFKKCKILLDATVLLSESSGVFFFKVNFVLVLEKIPSADYSPVNGQTRG